MAQAPAGANARSFAAAFAGVRIVGVRALACVAFVALAACRAQAPDAPTATPAAQAPDVAIPATGAAPATADPGDGFALLDASVVAPTDTLETLRARHGAANVVAGKVPGAEGEEFDGWILFPDDPARMAYVYLDDAGKAASARVIDDTGRSRWRREDGIRAGATLEELVARNGQPIRFMGFDWDYGGGVIGWNGGTLERDPPLGGVTLCASCLVEADDCYPLGDGEFDSATAKLDNARVAVCDFDVNLAPAASLDSEAP
jgi:hypothetical protein